MAASWSKVATVYGGIQSVDLQSLLMGSFPDFGEADSERTLAEDLDRRVTHALGEAMSHDSE